MGNSRHEPTCMLAHSLIDKLANLVNYCDLLNHEVESGSRVTQRVSVIQKIAREVIEELVDHQRKLAESDGGDKVA